MDDIFVGIVGCIFMIIDIFIWFYIPYKEWKSENLYTMKMNEIEHESKINERELRMLHELGPEIEIKERMRALGIKQAEDSEEDAI